MELHVEPEDEAGQMTLPIMGHVRPRRVIQFPRSPHVVGDQEFPTRKVPLPPSCVRVTRPRAKRPPSVRGVMRSVSHWTDDIRSVESGRFAARSRYAGTRMSRAGVLDGETATFRPGTDRQRARRPPPDQGLIRSHIHDGLSSRGCDRVAQTRQRFGKLGY